MITDSQNKTSRGKLNEALELLNEAASEKKEELKDMLTGKYTHIKDLMTADAQKAKSAVEDVIADGEERIKKAVTKVDSRVRKDPWPYVAATTAAALLLGYLMGSRR